MNSEWGKMKKLFEGKETHSGVRCVTGDQRHLTTAAMTEEERASTCVLIAIQVFCYNLGSTFTF